MNNKSKIFSLFLLGGLLLPVLFIAPQSNQGQVLGESDRSGENSSKNPAEIGSGVRETRQIESVSSDSAQNSIQKISGTVIWDENQVVNVSTNKFGLGKSIQVETVDGKFDLVVNSIRPELAEQTVMVVNKETFIKLGGNPEVDPNLTVTAWVSK